MPSSLVCDQRDCPAFAQHHIELYGQDFHFCSHHWAELQPILEAHLASAHTRAGKRSGRGDLGSRLAGSSARHD